MIAVQAAASANYTEALSRGGALVREMRSLLAAWRADEPPAEFAQRILVEDILAKATARTVRDYVRAFTRRFLVPDDAPARHLQQLLPIGAARQTVTDLIFLYTARQDDLLRDFTVLRYWLAARDGRLTMSTLEARELFWEAEQDGRIRIPWSAAVRRTCLPAS